MRHSRLIPLIVALPLVFAAMQSSAAEEEPGWAKGRPKTDTAMKMAPVPAFPIPTAAADLPTKKLKLPPGFKVETWASGVLDARELRQGDKGNIFVSTLFVGNKVYVLPEKAVDGKREPKVIIDKTEQATGIEFAKGSLFFATNKKIVRYDNVEDKLDNLGEPSAVLTDKLPGGSDHSWKYLRIHNNKLYYNIGAPCNICDPGEYAKIYSMNFDGSGVETIASGVRNTVGFDFDPKTGDLWFTNNGRDWLSEELPHDTLNHVSQPGKQHFGFPYCHQGNLPDPEFGWGKSCDDYAQPAALLGPHAGHEVLHRQDVPEEVPGCDVHRQARPVEPHQEVQRRLCGLARRQGRCEGRTLHDRLRREQHLPRSAGGLPHPEGRLLAGERRPRRRDLPHQLRWQVR
jgi:glucose/arabinose dehydrogenase